MAGSHETVLKFDGIGEVNGHPYKYRVDTHSTLAEIDFVVNGPPRLAEQ